MTDTTKTELLTDLSKATPAEIDAEWATVIISPRNALIARRHQLITLASSYAAFGANYAEQADRYRENAVKLAEKIAAFREIEAPYVAEWNARGGWNRAYAVQGGHIHRSTDCHSLYPTTLISWLPDQSGLPEGEIVKNAGEHACTICYPTAPVAELRERYDRERKEARASERAARAAAAAVKGITNPDGTTLNGKWGTIKTLVSAQRELTDALCYVKEWETELRDHPNFVSVTTEYRNISVVIAAAIAYKTGVTVETVLAEATVKAEKKYKRERG